MVPRKPRRDSSMVMVLLRGRRGLRWGTAWRRGGPGRGRGRRRWRGGAAGAPGRARAVPRAARAGGLRGVDGGRVTVELEGGGGDRPADGRGGVRFRRERHRVEDADDGEPLISQPYLDVAGRGADAEPLGRGRAEHDGRVP